MIEIDAKHEGHAVNKILSKSCLSKTIAGGLAVLNVAAATIASTDTAQARSFRGVRRHVLHRDGFRGGIGRRIGGFRGRYGLQNAHDPLGNRQFGTNGSGHDFPLAVGVGLGYGAACSYGYGGCNGVGYGLPVDLDLGYSAACAYGYGGCGS